MNLGRCPVCHAHIQLDALVQDDAGRELLALLAGMEPELARPLVGYIGLFRPEKQDLRNVRALQLARDVLALPAASPQQIATALAETVESIRAKGGSVLRNHNYLRRVLEGTPQTPAIVAIALRATPRTSKTADALNALEHLK
jgi:hypothetical protein